MTPRKGCRVRERPLTSSWVVVACQTTCVEELRKNIGDQHISKDVDLQHNGMDKLHFDTRTVVTMPSQFGRCSRARVSFSIDHST